jgi:hypothetical protein
MKYATSEIWFLRHGDKPKDSHSPCCSPKGLERADRWADYLAHRIDANQTRIMTSHFYTPKRHHHSPCQAYNPLPEPGKPHCQQSQRMFQTAHRIHRRLHDAYNFSSVGLFQEGCTGHQKKLPLDPYLIVVWEHTEIIDWIRQAGFPLGDWKDDSLYSLVFHMTTGAKPRLQYDCVDTETEQRTKCWQATQTWLQHVPVEQQAIRLEHPYRVGYVEGRIGIALYVFVLLFLLVRGCQWRRQAQRREGYINI